MNRKFLGDCIALIEIYKRYSSYLKKILIGMLEYLILNILIALAQGMVLTLEGRYEDVLNFL
jgi:hypothetical protein